MGVSRISQINTCHVLVVYHGDLSETGMLFFFQVFSPRGFPDLDSRLSGLAVLYLKHVWFFFFF